MHPSYLNLDSFAIPVLICPPRAGDAAEAELQRQQHAWSLQAEALDANLVHVEAVARALEANKQALLDQLASNRDASARDRDALLRVREELNTRVDTLAHTASQQEEQLQRTHEEAAVAVRARTEAEREAARLRADVAEAAAALQRQRVDLDGRRDDIAALKAENQQLRDATAVAARAASGDADTLRQVRTELQDARLRIRSLEVCVCVGGGCPGG